MDKSRDSSVLRSLAVAFGDGLAFGVGMKLTQTAAGKRVNDGFAGKVRLAVLTLIPPEAFG